MNKKFRHITSAIVVAVFLFIAFGSNDEKTTEISVASVAAIPPEIHIAAGNLTNDYNDEVAADEKYKGKVLRVSGRVYTPGSTPLGKIYVILDGHISAGRVYCYIAEEPEITTSDLSNHQIIQVKGKCVGKSKDGDVILSGCVVERITWDNRSNSIF